MTEFELEGFRARAIPANKYAWQLTVTTPTGGLIFDQTVSATRDELTRVVADVIDAHRRQQQREAEQRQRVRVAPPTPTEPEVPPKSRMISGKSIFEFLTAFLALAGVLFVLWLVDLAIESFGWAIGLGVAFGFLLAVGRVAQGGSRRRRRW